MRVEECEGGDRKTRKGEEEKSVRLSVRYVRERKRKREELVAKKPRYLGR